MSVDDRAENGVKSHLWQGSPASLRSLDRMRPTTVIEKHDERDHYNLYSLQYGGAARAPLKACGDKWALAILLSLRMPLSRSARRRLNWFFDHAHRFKGNARKTCRYYGISPQTFYQWKRRFNIRSLYTLEDRSHRPKNSPLPKLNPEQTANIFALRSAYPYYSKMKLAVIYERKWGQKISCWQVQKVIERFQLYPDRTRARRIRWKRLHALKKQRIHKLAKHAEPGYLVSLDTVVLHVNGEKRYILTAIDRYSRLAFMRAYKTQSSKVAADFIGRLYGFMDRKIQNVHTDNGCEFHRYFEQALKSFGLHHFWSRVRTPKDNAQLERFNRTLQEECPMIRQITDIEHLNGLLLEWQIEYNYDRPHEALGYRTPMEVFKGLPA